MSKRIKRVAVAAVVAGALLVPGARVALAEECAPGGPDFNDDGCADTVVADPDATRSGKSRAGKIIVVYGGSYNPTVLSQGQPGVGGSPETDDRFGTVLRTTRIDDDQYTDLVAGTPSESVGSADDAGIIHVIFGSAIGLGAGRAAKVLRQGRDNVPGRPEAGDRFGTAVAVNTTGGGYSPPVPAIAFGAPGEDIGRITDAGTAGVVAYDREADEFTAGTAIDQGSNGISGTLEPGDRFGTAVELFQGPGGFGCSVTGVQGFSLVVGVPGEDIGNVSNAGMVHVARNLVSDSPLTQNKDGVSGTSETGDQFGASLALTSFCEHDGPSHVTLAVGVPTEDIGDNSNAGMVHLFRTDDDEFPLPQRWSVHQNTDGVVGTAEAGDRFGSGVTLGGPWLGDGVGEPLLVSTPRENVGSAVDAGALYLFGDLEDAPGDSEIRLTQPDIFEPAEAGDQFGAAVSTNTTYLFIGAPDDARYPRGVVHGLLWDNLTGDGTGRQLLVPGSDGIPPDSVRFGAALA